MVLLSLQYDADPNETRGPTPELSVWAQYLKSIVEEDRHPLYGNLDEGEESMYSYKQKKSLMELLLIKEANPNKRHRQDSNKPIWGSII
jgi:hypothetical protein